MGKRSLLCLFIAVFFCLTPAFSENAGNIKLPEPRLKRGKLLMEALKERKSTRGFADKELPLGVISDLLWAASGVNRPDGRRTAPTAKNWQEIDIYVAMKKGLYVYNAGAGTLDLVLAKDIRASTGLQGFVKTAPVDLVFVADFSRMDGSEEIKKFYSAVDTGYISQNVYLFCASEGLATVVLGVVDRDRLAKEMELGADRRIILSQPVGYPE